MDLSQALRVTRRLEMLRVHSNGLIVVVVVILAPLSLAGSSHNDPQRRRRRGILPLPPQAWYQSLGAFVFHPPRLTPTPTPTPLPLEPEPTSSFPLLRLAHPLDMTPPPVPSSEHQ
jgi:hypothetical protein